VQINDIAMVNDACAALAKVARRSVEKHEARIAELKKLIALVEQFGAVETVERQLGDDKATTDVLRTALDRVSREEQRANVKVVGRTE
jgi:hypothetical protein